MVHFNSGVPFNNIWVTCLSGSGDWDTVQRLGRSIRGAGVQFPGRLVDFMFGFQVEINFLGRQRGFDSVHYNLWPSANIKLSDTQ